MKLFRLSLMACCMMALVACDSYSDRDIEKEKEEKTAEAAAAVKEKSIPICPQVAIVRDLDKIMDYGGEDKADPDHLVAGAKMLNVDGSCSYKKEGGIDITFDLSMIAARGPGLGGRTVSFPYFVAVVDPMGKILNKDSMTMEFHFSGDDKTAQDDQSLHVLIPLTKDQTQSGPSYQVLMGFQLTKEQLDQTHK